MLGMWKKESEGRPKGIELGGVQLGERPWLVLGGGGLKGLAHLGVWRELDNLGFRPTGILGTSIGALVGACIAGGQPIEELETEARALRRPDIARIQQRALWMNGIRSPSLFRGEILRRYLNRVLPREGWEGLEIRFQSNAVELATGRTEWFGIGARTDVSLSQAVYASAALPLFYPPIPLTGGIYVDGGTGDALPVRRAAELGATGIVAVDVGSGEEIDARPLVGRGMLAIHERVFSIMSGNRRREAIATWDGPPLLYIRPALDGFGNFDFEHLERFMEEGRTAAERVLRVLSVPESPAP